MVQSTTALFSQTILIVDDTPDILQLLFNYLKNAHYKILIAQSGKKALTIAEKMRPDLILLDVMMPELDGFTTCKRLKTNSLTANIPIIFMTALSQAEEKVKGLMLGAVDYVTKPIEEQELLARIKNHLSIQCLNRRLAKEAARQKLLREISDRIRQSLNLNSILETATKEIRTFFDCDFVGLTKITRNRQVVFKAANLTARELTGSANLSDNLQKESLKTTISYNNICENSQQYESYLQGEIRIIHAPTATSEGKTRLIVPILIKRLNVATAYLTGNSTANLPLSDSILWGWLIVERDRSIREWQTEEIDLLQEITSQLAIAIKQGQLHKQLSELALLDSLTRVHNRRYFDRQLNLEWRRLKRTPSPLSLIICDVDCFKIYNDTYGHQKGDKCLQQVAKAMSKVLKRPGDVLARYGGEEFTVILPHTPQSGAIKVAEAMRVAVKKLNIPHANSLVDSKVTISLGIASTVPNCEDNPQLLVEAADLALYQAKERGRDCLTVYPESIARSKDRQELKFRWIKRIRKAMERDLFSLYAQPIAPLGENDRIKYFEVLLRLTDEGDRVILPHVFLEIAERNFLMSDLDRWVINHLFEKLETMGDRLCQNNYRFSINLSGASLNSESFMQFLTQKMSNCRFPPHLFCFEITESIVISDLNKAVNFIKQIKNLGCSFALDDFGKGMSSLTYLKNLPVDYLKIDGSFIKELNKNNASKVMVEAINHIAEGIGLKTVAEFVEDREILEAVRQLKVDYAQGFHLGRPGVLMDVIGG